MIHYSPNPPPGRHRGRRYPPPEHEARRQRFIVLCRRVLVELVLAKGEANADDVYAAVSRPPDVHVNTFGSIPGPLVKSGILREDRIIRSARRARHEGRIARWTLADEARARGWLDDNPVEPEPVLRLMPGAKAGRAGQLSLFDMKSEPGAPTPGEAGGGSDVQSSRRL